MVDVDETYRQNLVAESEWVSCSVWASASPPRVCRQSTMRQRRRVTTFKKILWKQWTVVHCHFVPPKDELLRRNNATKGPDLPKRSVPVQFEKTCFAPQWTLEAPPPLRGGWSLVLSTQVLELKEPKNRRVNITIGGRSQRPAVVDGCT